MELKPNQNKTKKGLYCTIYTVAPQFKNYILWEKKSVLTHAHEHLR